MQNKSSNIKQKIKTQSIKKESDTNDTTIWNQEKSKTNENMLTGRTETNKVVNFEGTDDMIGKIINLKIVSEHMWYLKGEV